MVPTAPSGLPPSQTGKVLLVLNEAAEFHDSFLKNTLLTEPDLLQLIIHDPIRFRQYQYAISADTEGMPLQICVILQDQPSFRFFWREDPAEKITLYQYVRQLFGAKESPTCANYALKRTRNEHETTFPEATLSVQDNFYTDDYLESSPTVE